MLFDRYTKLTNVVPEVPEMLLESCNNRSSITREHIIQKQRIITLIPLIHEDQYPINIIPPRKELFSALHLRPDSSSETIMPQQIQFITFLVSFIKSHPDIVAQGLEAQFNDQNNKLFIFMCYSVIPSFLGFFSSSEHITNGFSFYCSLVSLCNNERIIDQTLIPFFCNSCTYRFIELTYYLFGIKFCHDSRLESKQIQKEILRKYYTEPLIDAIIKSYPLIPHTHKFILKYMISNGRNPKSVLHFFLHRFAFPQLLRYFKRTSFTSHFIQLKSLMMSLRDDISPCLKIIEIIDSPSFFEVPSMFNVFDCQFTQLLLTSADVHVMMTALESVCELPLCLRTFKESSYFSEIKFVPFWVKAFSRNPKLPSTAFNWRPVVFSRLFPAFSDPIETEKNFQQRYAESDKEDIKQQNNNINNSNSNNDISITSNSNSNKDSNSELVSNNNSSNINNDSLSDFSDSNSDKNDNEDNNNDSNTKTTLKSDDSKNKNSSNSFNTYRSASYFIYNYSNDEDDEETHNNEDDENSVFERIYLEISSRCNQYDVRPISFLKNNFTSVPLHLYHNHVMDLLNSSSFTSFFDFTLQHEIKDMINRSKTFEQYLVHSLSLQTMLQWNMIVFANYTMMILPIAHNNMLNVLKKRISPTKDSIQKAITESLNGIEDPPIFVAQTLFMMTINHVINSAVPSNVLKKISAIEKLWENHLFTNNKRVIEMLPKVFQTTALLNQKLREAIELLKCIKTVKFEWSLDLIIQSLSQFDELIKYDTSENTIIQFALVSCNNVSFISKFIIINIFVVRQKAFKVIENENRDTYLWSRLESSILKLMATDVELLTKFVKLQDELAKYQIA